MTASIMDAQTDLKQYPMVVEVLIKPFSAATLLAAIERALHTTLSRQA
jgi:FixJ family two-component response regulator